VTKRHLGLVLIIAVAAATAIGAWFFSARGVETGALQRQANPGPLSAAHASLEQDCAGCHTPVAGPDDAKCVGCHAGETALVQRQPTAFHADIGNCSQCHIEHRGRDANLRAMDHEALARIGLDRLGSAHATAGLEQDVVHWVNAHPGGKAPTPSHPETSPLEATLNCSTCHATSQPHSGLFGDDCASCHSTQHWTVARFQHPSPQSTECAQCHQAPPSHYMGHFEMVSKKVAKPLVPGTARPHEGARVEQCQLCHETTSWNDIDGTGWYKHH
jgi:hypothetical protein